MEMAKRTARPSVKTKRAIREVHLEPRPIVSNRERLREYGPEIAIALGWVFTALLGALMYAGVEVWAVFEVGFAAAVTFGIGAGWHIGREEVRRGRR